MKKSDIFPCKGDKVEVRMDGNTVILTGVVVSKAESDWAYYHSLNTIGTKRVINNIVVERADNGLVLD